MRSVLMSIRPTWAQKIDRGEKTVEIRKSYPIQLETPFRVYLYCTRGKDQLIEVVKDGAKIYGETYHGKPFFITMPEGGYCERVRRQTVFGEFVCDGVEWLPRIDTPWKPEHLKRYATPKTGNACLSVDDLEKYGKGAELYSWHISEYQFYKFAAWKRLEDFGLKRPPQSWCYVEELQ